MPKILLAEDEEVLRMLVVDTLEDEGYQVEEACDGQEAMEMILEKDYDLIILDYMMPILTGVEVIQKIKSLPHKKDLKIMMLSAKSQKMDQEQVKAAGADFFVSKPFSPTKLAQMIGDVLRD